MESAVANEWDAIKALFEAFEAYFQNNDCEVISTQLNEVATNWQQKISEPK